MVTLPKIGETITIERWKELAEFFGLDRVVKELSDHPERYRPWTFDGCSGPPQSFFRATCGDKYQLVTDYICGPHDLEHALGGTEEDRAKSNADFKSNLIDLAGFDLAKACAFYAAVVVGGYGELDTAWKWGFALVTD